MITTLLIANRGEIACRIIRTARRMGIATVAVHSDADARAMHVAMADRAVRIGPAPVSESYLKGDAIIAAALETGADAIHPGYGFLSENPDFAEAVIAAGLTWVGPPPSAIRAMGLKDAAKRLMEKAGVPVVPGYHGEAQDIVLLAGKANEIGYPVLIKARAGGGGKGMRKVDRPEDFKDALSAARREAKAAFGDDRVLVEKYVQSPRHIEVQVFGDSHGNVVHLYERDCSLQRRHQKVIEEAPAPGMPEKVRKAMTDAAVKAAKAIGYQGAGTIEFIADGSKGLRTDGFWFMEMNTRLQVEHPVTEAVTGIDLVEWQLRVAAGEPIPRSQEQIELCGHAFEARVYAEDPARDFLPATGTLHHLAIPGETGGGCIVRVDTGVREGDTISPFYDPMIAKVIVQGLDRATALAGLADVLSRTQIAGSTVNTGFLAALAKDEDFCAGKADTGLIASRQAALTKAPELDGSMVANAALAASGIRPAGNGNDPWDAFRGYGHFHPLPVHVELLREDDVIGARLTVRPDGKADIATPDGSNRTLAIAGETGAVAWPGHVTVFRDGHAVSFGVRNPFADAEASAGGDSLRAPMPGLVKIVSAAAGESVSKGQPLLVLEAMKMEHSISAPHDGTIAEIVSEGSQVSDGTVLVRFSED